MIRQALLAAGALMSFMVLAVDYPAGEADFVAGCMSTSNLGDELCTCAAEKAKEELSPGGFDFLVAGMHGDEAATASLRAELPVDELMVAGMFMANAPNACAQQLDSQ